MKRGKFIVVDGGEGSGKTTVLKWFAKTPFGKQFLITHEPGGTEFADKIRKLVLSEEAKEAGAETQFGLMWAARAEHLKKKIIPALAKGVSVISDRFDSSTYAYQIYGQKAKHLEKLFWQTREVFLRDKKPDLYIFLGVEPKIGLERVTDRKETKTHFDERKLEFHKRVCEGFLEFLKHVPHKTIDANQSLKTVKTDFLKCVKMVL
ncbi:MAG: dTMP kinase [Parcubacteria group bacterium Gr01-1014_73]|nr:MAG: dTMP kinase [Parcubacteria group bacterium Gr01-1014_73]